MWKYKDKVIEKIEDFGENIPHGFVYITTHIPSGKKYLGKKSLYHNITKKLTKKAIAEQVGPGRKKMKESIQKESDWKTYYGSADFIVSSLKENKRDEFSREIIYLAPNKKLLTYFEVKYQFIFEVLEKPDIWLNSNIQGSFFTKDFISLS